MEQVGKNTRGALDMGSIISNLYEADLQARKMGGKLRITDRFNSDVEKMTGKITKQAASFGATEILGLAGVGTGLFLDLKMGR